MTTFEASFEVLTDDLERALRELAYVRKAPYGKIVKQNGRLLAVNLAYQTQPLGDGQASREQGENAVRRDLRRVYVTPQAVYAEMKKAGGHGRRTGEQMARAFVSALYKGDLVRARRILERAGINGSRLHLDKFDGGAQHKRRRNSRGRVGSGMPMIVSNPEKLERYEKTIIKRVGSAKGGWAAAARPLGGTRGIPQFVSRHKGGGAAIDRTSDQDHPHVILRNTVPWIRQVLTPRQMQAAIRIQEEKMRAHIHITTIKAARRAGFKAAA